MKMSPNSSKIFNFSTILKQSIQVLPKIWKSVVPITAASLTLTSLLILLFTHTYDTLVANFAEESQLRIMIISFAILLAAELACLFLYITAANISGSSTIMATAACYTGKSYSPSELLSGAAEKARRNPFNRGSFRGGGSKTVILLSVIVGLLTGIVIGVHMVNPVTVCLLFVLWLGNTALWLRSTAGGALIGVVMVVEEGENCEAVERFEQIIEGPERKKAAYMIDLSLNAVVMVIALVLWVVIGDRGSQNMRVYGLVGFNLIVVVRVCVSVVYTVFYFECKEYHKLLSAA